ncbi:hypothetical protein TBS_22660 [Thermobispora bispora]|uniref:murein hydrolase activator EnvC family protein n=1 Tax=Thermobispora bispora TaxID=2006 RepID=UPI0030E75E64
MRSAALTLALALVCPAAAGAVPAAGHPTAPEPRSPVSGASPWGPGSPAADPGSGADAVRGTAPAPDWRWPLAGHPNVIRRFDPPARPWLSGHRGVDLAARAGQEVRAAGAGLVLIADRVVDRGVVSIRHRDGLRTTYLPVRPLVRQGQRVAAGQVIGVIEAAGGWAGHCPEVCLHWGLIHRDRYLDPLLLLGMGQVRLLPNRPTRGPGH